MTFPSYHSKHLGHLHLGVSSQASIWDDATRIFKYFKIPLDDQIYLEYASFDDLAFERIGDETKHSLRSQSGPRDEVLEELDWDAPTSDQLGGQITMQAIWKRLGSVNYSTTFQEQLAPSTLSSLADY